MTNQLSTWILLKMAERSKAKSSKRSLAEKMKIWYILTQSSAILRELQATNFLAIFPEGFKMYLGDSDCVHGGSTGQITDWEPVNKFGVHRNVRLICQNLIVRFEIVFFEVAGSNWSLDVQKWISEPAQYFIRHFISESFVLFSIFKIFWRSKKEISLFYALHVISRSKDDLFALPR